MKGVLLVFMFIGLFGSMRYNAEVDENEKVFKTMSIKDRTATVSRETIDKFSKKLFFIKKEK